MPLLLLSGEKNQSGKASVKKCEKWRWKRFISSELQLSDFAAAIMMGKDGY